MTGGGGYKVAGVAAGGSRAGGAAGTIHGGTIAGEVGSYSSMDRGDRGRLYGGSSGSGAGLLAPFTGVPFVLFATIFAGRKRSRN